ncbi:hypothetical protein PLICRDRAFT_594083 [Plicaturopsis crispa FD-325 SS-3]|nr:hypothetical protein PLICRDRAFT_594083 [Plicaturopsis crispa FD-325 SS-3]
MSTCTWDFVVVGSGGGPDETNLSAYLMKPSNSPWEDGVVALEAGSGQGALKQILKQSPDILGQCSDEDGSTRRYTAHEIFSYIRCFLITHAHLDHVSSLVLSAGSLGGPRKRLFGTPQVLKDLETIFSDRVWPNLASWEEADDTHKYLYTSLRLDAKYRNIHNDISVRTMPLSHGQNDSGLYESSAFFIRHDVTAQEFLCLEHRFASRKECAHVESRYIERGRHEELNECLQGLQFSPLQAPRRRLSSD